MSKTTIVLADDHSVVRQGLRALLETQPDFTIVGEAGDGLEAVRLVERLEPRVLVLDQGMPALTGLEVTRQVCRRWPETKVVFLSMHADEAYVLEALRNGARGYVLKDATAADLVKAIREVVAGRRYLSAPFSDHAIEIYVNKTKTPPPSRYDTLTTREREVLQLAAEGHRNPQIAKRLFISPRTVEIHRANMMLKLDLHNQTELIRYALDRGLLPRSSSPTLPDRKPVKTHV